MQFKEFTHEYWINKVLSFAKTVRSEIPVCAIIVKANKLISKAINQTESLKDPTAHAEIITIRDASIVLDNWRLNDCVLYTTLEPCAMCAGAIINSRISTLVFSAYDTQSGACGSVVNLFSDLNKQNQINVIGGVLELEASKLLKEFFTIRR